MEKTVIILAVTLTVLILGMPVIAGAGWSQQWYENGLYGEVNGGAATHYQFTKYEAFILSDPSKTQWEGLSTDSSGSDITGWKSEIVSPTYAVMYGPAIGDLYFTTSFSGSQYPGFSLDLVVWNGNTIVGAENISIGSGYSYQELDVKDANVLAAINSLNRSPVPAPNAALLLGAGLIGLIGARRKLFV